MEKRVLVTGAAGFVGRYLVEKLVERGYRVLAVDTCFPLALPACVETVTGDLTEPSGLTCLPRKWWGVIHLAAISVPSQFATVLPVLSNLQMTMNLLEHLEEARVLIVSSCHVYGAASTPRSESSQLQPAGRYGLSKYLCEQLMSHYNCKLDIRIARPFNHIGVGMREELMIPSLIRRLLNSSEKELKPLVMKGTNSVRDFVDIRDIVMGYIAILETEVEKHRIFNVCTGKGYSIETLARNAMELFRIQPWVAFENSLSSNDDIPYLVGDSTLACECMGWKTTYSLADSLENLIQYYRR